MFEVTAGKYEDDGELNCKYSDVFETIEAALAAREKVRSYPWSRLTLSGTDFVYEIDPVKILAAKTCKDGERRFFPCNDKGVVYLEYAHH